MPTKTTAKPIKKTEAASSGKQALKAEVTPKRKKPSTLKVVPGDTRIEAKAVVKSGKLRGRSVTVLLEPEELVREQVNGFVTFLREKAIVGLMIGFVVGSQLQAVVKQLTASFFDPAFQLFFGGVKLSDRTFTVHLWQNSADFGWGGIAYALLNLIFVLALIYALVKIFQLDKLDGPKKAADAEPEKKAAAKSRTAKKSTKSKAAKTKAAGLPA